MKNIGRIILLVASVVGVIVSVQLLGIHIMAKAGDLTGAAALCSSGGGCGGAANSAWSAILGVPIAGLGFALYVAAITGVLYSAIVSRGETPGPGVDSRIFVGMFGIAVVYSVVLAIVNYFVLESPCSKCTMLYVVNIVGAVGAFMLYRGSEEGTERSPVNAGLAVVAVTLIAAVAGATVYTRTQAAAEAVELAENQSPEGDVSEFLYREHASRVGDDDATVRIVEFSDFECPFCSNFASTLGEVKESFEADELQVVFRNYPLSFHAHARDAALAGICAEKQGDFWPLHDAIFANQRTISRERILELASQLNIDSGELDACMRAESTQELIVQDLADGDAAGVQGTPTVFINGSLYQGARDAASLRRLVEGMLDEE